jgi:hypothetical protein
MRGEGGNLSTRDLGFIDVSSALSNLFTNVAGDTILQFLKEIDLYTKI